MTLLPLCSTIINSAFSFNVNIYFYRCINFANEKLQQHFNQSTFKDEQAIYISEEIANVPDIHFADNQDLIHMMEKNKNPAGLLVMLDEGTCSNY